MANTLMYLMNGNDPGDTCPGYPECRGCSECDPPCETCGEIESECECVEGAS